MPQRLDWKPSPEEVPSGLPTSPSTFPDLKSTHESFKNDLLEFTAGMLHFTNDCPKFYRPTLNNGAQVTTAPVAPQPGQ